MCLQLAEHSGKTIKQVHRSGDLKIVAKENIGFNDLFTIADTTIQRTIEYNLKSLYPYIKIVGEEDNSSLQGIEPTLQPD